MRLRGAAGADARERDEVRSADAEPARDAPRALQDVMRRLEAGSKNVQLVIPV